MGTAVTVAVASVVVGPLASADADNGYAISPAVVANSGGFSTKVTVTGTGVTASSTVEIDSCASAGAPPVTGVKASAGNVTFLVGGFVPGACKVNVVNGGTKVAAGTITIGGNFWFVSPVGIVPSILPTTGDASFLLTANKANTVAPSTSANGNPNTLTGATSAALTCAGSVIPATISMINDQQATITPGSLSAVPSGTPCSVTVTLSNGNTFDSSALNPQGVWVDQGVPMVTVTPDSGPAGQDPKVLPKIQNVTIKGTGLDKATAVNFAFCPLSNPTAINAATILSRSNGGGALSVEVPNVPVSADPPCAVEVVLPADSKRAAGYTVASVPRKTTTGYSGGFTFTPPYQGPITFTVANPYDGSSPRSGVTDTKLHLCLVGKPNTPSVAPNFGTGVNLNTLTCKGFTGLPQYSATKHSATFTLSSVLESGVLYFADQDISGNAPDATTSTARFGIFELTYDTGGVHSDMTLIDQVGFTMSSEYFPKGETTPFTGSHRDTGCLVDIVNALSTSGVNMKDIKSGGVMKYSGTPPATLPRPGKWTAANLSSDSGWIGLIGASKRPTAYPTVQKYIAGVTGPLSITDHLGNDKNYSGDFDYMAALVNGIWTLTGTIKNGNAAGPKIEVEQAGLSGAGTHGGTGYGVYGQDGPIQVSLPTGGTPTSPTYGPGNGWSSDGGAHTGGTISPDWSNLLKTIYRDFVVGFAYGYWGSSETAGGGKATGLNAVNFTQNPVTKAYKNAQPKYPTSGEYAWNVYDDVIRSLSNVNGVPGPEGVPSGAYGMPYSDTYVPSALSPEGGQANIYAWNITLGDPTGCKASSPSLEPAKQLVQVKLGGVIKPVLATATRATTKIANMVEYTPENFTGPVRYILSGVGGKPARLPSGLRFSKSTGVISGTPTSTMAHTVFIVHGISGSESATAEVTLSVGKQVITPAKQTLIGHLGTRITPTATFNTNTLADQPTFSIDPALPAGLVLDKRTGVVSGTPTQTQPARAYLVTASALGGDSQANLSITVDAPWAIAPSAQQVNGTVGTAISPSAPFNLTGFETAPAFTVTLDLPSGLRVNATTGSIYGVPDTASPVRTYTVQARGQYGSAYATVAITVNSSEQGVAPSNQSLTLQQGVYGASAPLTASGFAGPVTYAISPSLLPRGMSFNRSTGVVSGTPAQPWSPQAYTLTASDLLANAKSMIQLSVIVPSAPAPAPAPIPTPTPIPTQGWCSPASQQVNGVVGSALSTASLSIGAPAPVYVLANGSPGLPAGLNGPGYSSGVISGTPTQAGTTTVQIHCQGQSGYQAFATVTFAIAAAPTPTATPTAA